VRQNTPLLFQSMNRQQTRQRVPDLTQPGVAGMRIVGGVIDAKEGKAAAGTPRKYGLSKPPQVVRWAFGRMGGRV
jgi:hypothetical protein